jgi:uncharacterized delta-60 repeat protein
MNERRNHLPVCTRVQGRLARHALWRAAIGCAILLVFADAASALAPGHLDPTFGTDGVVTEQFGTGTKAETDLPAVAVQSDGKVVTAGDVYDGTATVFVARFNKDGSLDQSFANNGKLVTQFGAAGEGGSEALSAVVQADGKIIVGGWAADPAANADLLLLRLNPDGSLDPTFGIGGVVRAALGSGPSGEQDAEARELALQPDGKIVVGGDASNSSGHGELLVARFNRDGSLDPAFASGGWGLSSAAALATAIALQSDGKVVASGYHYATGGSEVLLTRFNADGSIDSSFASAGTLATQLGVGCSACASPQSEINALAVQPDGKILGAGFADDAENRDSLVIRLNGDGSFDPAFGTGGEVLDEMGMANNVVSQFSELSSVALQANGRLVVGGTGSDENGNYAFLLARLTAVGAPDPSFDSARTIVSQLGTTASPSSYVKGVALTSDGKLVAAGEATDTDGFAKLALARLIVDLPPVASFATSPTPVQAGAPVSFSALASADPDGAIARYSWNFGDGSAASTARPTHTFARAGTYAVTLTVADDDALTASTTQTVMVTAAPSATPSPGPQFLRVFETARRWREGTDPSRVSRKRRPPVGTKFVFTLNESAQVVLSFAQKRSGRRVVRECVAPSQHNRRRPRCSRVLNAGTLAVAGHAGTNTVRFAGRTSRSHRLGPGAYTVTITATDSAGRRAVAELTFTVVKG